MVVKGGLAHAGDELNREIVGQGALGVKRQPDAFVRHLGGLGVNAGAALANAQSQPGVDAVDAGKGGQIQPEGELVMMGFLRGAADTVLSALGLSFGPQTVG